MLSTYSYAEDYLKDYNIYFFGVVKHFKPSSDSTNEGNMNYFAISKSKKYTSWELEGGIGTYIDSYSLRSYTLFSNIYSDDYKYGIVKPMLNLAVHYKGDSYTSDKRKIKIAPSLKIRVGDTDGFFVDIMPVPYIKGLTNGFISLEFGYQF